MQIIKLPEALELFKELIIYYSTIQLMEHIKKNNFLYFDEIKKSLSTKIQRTQWLNVGGQLMSTADIDKLKREIKSNKIQTWQQLHDIYQKTGANYNADKLSHAYTSLLEILNITSKQFTADTFKSVLQKAVNTKKWMSNGVYQSREKDYTNPFRKMMYDTKAEMDKVIGKLEANTFIQQQLGEFDSFKKEVKQISKSLDLN